MRFRRRARGSPSSTNASRKAGHGGNHFHDEEIERALRKVTASADRKTLLETARVLGTVKDPTRLEALAAKFGIDSAAGRMVRLRLGIVNLLCEDYAGSANILEETFLASGRPDGGIDLLARACIGADRFRSAVNVLADTLPWRRLPDWKRKGTVDFNRTASLASLLADRRTGIKDPAAFIEGHERRRKAFPADVLRQLMFCLHARGRPEDSFSVATGLLRRSRWNPYDLPLLLRRLEEAGRPEAVRRFYLEAYGVGDASDVLAAALALDLVEGEKREPEIILEGVEEAFPGPGFAGPRGDMLDALARTAWNRRDPDLAAASLEALVNGSGRRPDLLRRLESAYTATDKIDDAARIARELIRMGRFDWEEIRILQNAVKEGRFHDEWLRIQTSRFEMELYRPERLFKEPPDQGK
ncbi:MAG: hypothetical protein ACYTHN_21285 [Planctomycetota bacterium]